MFEFLKTFIYYPVAAIVHGLQGILVGILGVRAIIHKEVSDAIIALLIAISFFTYEITEQWSIGDHAFADIEVMWMMALLTGGIYAVIHFYGKHYGGN